MNIQRTPPSNTQKLSGLSASNPDIANATNSVQRVKRPRQQSEEEMNDVTTELTTFKTEIKEMIETFMDKQDQEFKKYAKTLKETQQTNANIEHSLAFLTEQNDVLKRKIESLEVQMKEDKKYISILEDKIENMQMDSRKSNFEIKSVPKKDMETKEDLIDMVLNLSANIGGQLKKEDIKDIYRVRGKKENTFNTPIIVETSSTIVKNDTLKLCKAFNVKHKEKLRAKHLGFRSENTENTPIYVSEQLTARASRLHFLARDLVKSKSYKFCWTAYGKVYVRKDEGSPIIMIRSEIQIQNLINGQ